MMIRYKHLIVLALAAVLTAGCAEMGTTAKSQAPDEAAQAIAAAKAAMKKASEAGGLWRDTGKILKKAEAAAAAGDKAKAVKLATQARRQAELGEAQAHQQQHELQQKAAKGVQPF